MTETWKPIPDFPGYEVGEYGMVRSYHKLGGHGCGAGICNTPQRILAPGKDRYGYYIVSLSCNGIRATKAIHRLITAAFIGPCPEGLEVNHKDGDKLNNNIVNLEYITGIANMKHAHAAGLYDSIYGESNPSAKLTAGAVKAIRSSYEAGGVTHHQLSKEYGCSKTAIGDIVNRRTWKHA